MLSSMARMERGHELKLSLFTISRLDMLCQKHVHRIKNTLVRIVFTASGVLKHAAVPVKDGW